MSLDKYLEERKMDFFKQKVESLIGIHLKTILQWLIHKD